MTVPIEFVALGRPSSVNGTSAKMLVWKEIVSDIGKVELAQKFAPNPIAPPYTGDVTVKIFFFPPNGQYTDIDNGLKHTIDALCTHNRPIPPAAPFAPILSNDKTVLRITSERFTQIAGASLLTPVGLAPTLLKALMIANGQASIAAGGPFNPEYATAIKFEPYINNNGGLW